MSKEAGVVTFVDAKGKRETWTLERVLKEQRYCMVFSVYFED